MPNTKKSHVLRNRAQAQSDLDQLALPGDPVSHGNNKQGSGLSYQSEMCTIPNVTTRKRGPAYPLTLEWQQDARAVLRQRNWKDAHLATRLKLTRTDIHRALSPKYVLTGSRWAPEISKELGIDLPSPKPRNVSSARRELDKILELLEQQDPHRFKAIEIAARDALSAALREVEEARSKLIEEYKKKT